MKHLVAMLAIGASALFGAPESVSADTASYVVAANSTDSIDLSLTEGEFLLTVVGDRGSDLDFYIYDAVGTLIFIDEDETDLTFTTFFVSAEGGDYRLLVVNQGDVSNNYRVDLL